ncbi:MAG: hypothetical protein ACREWI_05230 [Telluria sp.]
MSHDLVMDRGTEDAKMFARILYVAHALTFLFSAGLLSILVLIVITSSARRPRAPSSTRITAG